MKTKLEDYGRDTELAQRDNPYTLLPDPERRDRYYTVVSVDDHVVEPPDTFEGRIPQKYQDRAPRVVTDESGREAWLYDDQILPNIGFNAVAGRPMEELYADPTRFDQMRRGTWDVHARIRDMDLDGSWGSIGFPSYLAGFAGARLQTITPDRDLAFVVLKAYNDWHLEGWCGAYPERLIPMQLPWLHDPVVGAEEIRQNAARGFRGVTFPEAPEKLGFPSLFTGHWDPFMRACEETETVVCVHTGSSGFLPDSAEDAPTDVPTVLVGLSALNSTVHWLYSLIPLRFPDIKICMSEGGIGWVAGLLDRLDHSQRYSHILGTWAGAEVSPSEALTRNFWFCALDDPSSFCTAERVGADRIVLEIDYPHADTSWPDSQALWRRSLDGLPDDLVTSVTWRNASRLFRFDVPEAVQRDPNAF